MYFNLFVLIYFARIVKQCHCDKTEPPFLSTIPYNTPTLTKDSLAEQKFLHLRDYQDVYKNLVIDNTREMKSFRNALFESGSKLSQFIEIHMLDLRKLLVALDKALTAMMTIKLNKKMSASEQKIQKADANIPYGVYVSPEFKCLGDTYYVASSHNQQDAQMILSSERKPFCYDYKGVFSFNGHSHRADDEFYVGPHSEIYLTSDPNQGLYCLMDEFLQTHICIYKVMPVEEFPESVEFEPKVSYRCGGYKYYIPVTDAVRCIFYISSMNFVFHFALEGVKYKTNGMAVMLQNGQVFYTDEPWSLISCTNFVCKFRHHQNFYLNKETPEKY